MKVININGCEIDFEASVNFMDDEIRKALNCELSPCTDQEFFTAYEKAHAAKYGEVDWEFSKPNPCI